METNLETHIQKEISRRRMIFRIFYMAAYASLIFFGPRIVNILLPKEEFLIDVSDRLTLSNASLISSISFFFIADFFISRRPKLNKPIILMLHPALALMIYMVCLILYQPLLIHPSSLEIGKRYHLVFIDGNGRKVVGDKLYRLPHHDQKRSSQMRTFLFGGLPLNQYDENQKDYFPYTLRLENRLAEKYKNFTLRFYLDTLRVSVELEQPANPNPPEYVLNVPNHFKDEKLEERIYITAAQNDPAILDVPFDHFEDLTILLPLEVNGNPVKYVHSDYVDIEMEILNQLDH